MKLHAIFLAYFMQGVILAITVYSIVIGDYSVAISGVVALFLTMIPAIVKRQWHITIPWFVTFLIALTLFFHVAGYFFGWYLTFYPYYDKIAHLTASITIALLGFLMVLILHRYGDMKCSRTMTIFYIIIFTLALGAIWEIIEYFLDFFLHTGLQHGNDDTMIDLITDLLGGIVVAFLGGYYLKRRDEAEIVDAMIVPGQEANIPVISARKLNK
jgi:uncharacterized membrane protein YjdF